jgi:dTDP-4-dehydrorhamnose reductase
MKILITGANGMLAQEVKKQLNEGNELVCTDVQDLDITKAISITL